VARNEDDQVGAPPRSAKTVILPAAVGAVLGFLLSTVGFIGVAFGSGTMCTTYYETGNHCDSLYPWLEAGLIGQGVILAASLAVLFIGPMVPAKRRLMAISAWSTVGLAVVWYAAYATGASHSW
jgi:hypothetical protein